jgi:two-component system cell cycle response regulator CpdR
MLRLSQKVDMSRLVLVVDDEPLILELTGSMLEDLGCEVVTASCGVDALAKLNADTRIEILITDIQMPGLDGYELAERARRRRPELQIILCSGRADAAHGLPLIRKPFTQEELAEMMAHTTGLCS